MTTQPLNVLFLCTGNSARSILAESIPLATLRGSLRSKVREIGQLQGASLPRPDVA